MSGKSISELSGKEILYRHFSSLPPSEVRWAVSTPSMLRLRRGDNFDQVVEACEKAGRNFWLPNTPSSKMVIKPDQLIKRRGKQGLVVIGNMNEVKEAFGTMQEGEREIEGVRGSLDTFIVESFVEHKPEQEFYLAITSKRDHDLILFSSRGGVDVGDVDEDCQKLEIPVDLENSMVPEEISIVGLLHGVDMEQEQVIKLGGFIDELYRAYKSCHFTYLEINPLVVNTTGIHILDLAAKVDQTASFLCKDIWMSRYAEPIEFPAPFGLAMSAEEKYISSLDDVTGASLKLTILNRKGRIWTMVAGGGASVVYADAICELGGVAELANYGEYSGDPSLEEIRNYASTILSLMTEGAPHADGKLLFIGGSIANFTNVGETFQGIIQAIESFALKLQDHKISIYVRRGGPNHKEGLRKMKDAGKRLGLPIFVYGPETPLTAIVGAGLKGEVLPEDVQDKHANFVVAADGSISCKHAKQEPDASELEELNDDTASTYMNNMSSASSLKSFSGTATSEAEVVAKSFTLNEKTTAVVWGQQQKAIQGMLDFDWACGRATPSVAASTYPYSDNTMNKFYFGQEEKFLPSYRSMKDAFDETNATVLVCFASYRSAYDVVKEALETIPQLQLVAIIAEGVPERQTRHLIKIADTKGVTIVGPATVGGIKPGCFKIGNTGGMIDNILASKLYQPGSVAYVTRSGGLSNELNNIISRNSDGVYEGVAIGGDRYPGSTFKEHVARYILDDNVKIIVLLGESGGLDEYDVIKMMSKLKIRKPIIAWCIGTCAKYINKEISFGHAGSGAASKRETAIAKNEAFRKAGFKVPKAFDGLGQLISKAYEDELMSGRLQPREEITPRAVPLDYNWACELGIIRRPTSFVTSICDERGNGPLYSGVPLSEIVKKDSGIGGVLSLLWFQKELPEYGSKFLELCLMITADHGPAVSGAHNTIVCTRAGKDMVSSLVSGLLTIGDRFGGALDGAAKQFSSAYDRQLTPCQFVDEMRKKGKPIMGIGHKVKSIHNPDFRVEMLKEYVMSQFQQPYPLLNYALEVQRVTTAKKASLILNVDGIIGVVLVDLLRHSKVFTDKEAQNIIDIGTLNGIFVLGRSIGLIGHFLDQRRLRQGLYRHPWDDISYVLPERERLVADM